MKLGHIFALALGMMIVPVAAAEAADCADLTGRRFGDAVIVEAQAVTAGQAAALPELAPPAGTAAANAPKPAMPAFCRVKGAIHPVATSDIRFETWIPLDSWNRRYWATGNGGWAGYFNYADMASAVRRGYATSSTDTGHGGNNALDPRALAGAEALRDWTDRAIHLTAVASKQVIAALRGQNPVFSYFSGCSNGGRQGLISAQRYPEDFDGILAGAPANIFPTIASNNRAAWLLLRDPATSLSMGKLELLHEAVLRQCDALDGLSDRLVSEPRRCKVDMSSLRCTGADGDSCLTDAQIALAARLYGGAGGDQTPAQDFADGFLPGSERNWLMVARVADANMGWVKLKVHADGKWELADFDPLRDPIAIRDSRGDIDPEDADLSRFLDRGGKMILYTGLAETLMPYRSTEVYVDKVHRVMGARADKGVAFFPVPGRGHCSGGPLEFYNISAGADPTLPVERDMPGALQAWVEKGRRPETVVMRHVDTAADAAPGAAEHTRPLCAYPKVARWSGKGDVGDARTFTCVEPGTT